jgi:hypothetical protein
METIGHMTDKIENGECYMTKNFMICIYFVVYFTALFSLCVASDDRMIDELKRICREAVVA